MKQQMKILITRKGDESEGIWLTLPISQKHFEKLTRDVDFDEIEITNNIGGNAAPLTFLCYNGKNNGELFWFEQRSFLPSIYQRFTIHLPIYHCFTTNSYYFMRTYKNS